MAQSFPLKCPDCGNAVEAGQRFCNNCGAALGESVNIPTESAVDQQATQRAPSNTPPPPPPASFGSTPWSDSGAKREQPTTSPVYPPAPIQGPQTGVSPNPQFHQQETSESIVPPPPPAYQAQSGWVSSPQYNATPLPPVKKKRSYGCLVTTIVVLVILLGSSAGCVFFFHPFNLGRANAPLTENSNTPATGGSGATSGGSSSSISSPTVVSSSSTPAGSLTPTAVAATTEQTNLKVTYSSIDLTIKSVQAAASFVDDTDVPNAVRINIDESNPTSTNVSYSDSEVFHLLLPDGSVVKLGNSQQSISPDASTNRTNWLDFAISGPMPALNKLVLRLGTATDNQMNIPLKAGADLSHYQPTTASLNLPISYGGLDWTLVSAIKSFSADGVQAGTGMRYLTLAFRIDNKSATNQAIFVKEFMRMKAGDVINIPTDSTLPVTIAASTIGTTGNIFFVVPENVTSFTLELLPNQSLNVTTEVDTNFQAA